MIATNSKLILFIPFLFVKKVQGSICGFSDIRNSGLLSWVTRKNPIDLTICDRRLEKQYQNQIYNNLDKNLTSRFSLGKVLFYDASFLLKVASCFMITAALVAKFQAQSS